MMQLAKFAVTAAAIGLLAGCASNGDLAAVKAEAERANQTPARRWRRQPTLRLLPMLPMPGCRRSKQLRTMR